MTFGIRYIRERTPLLLLLSVFAASNFLISLSNSLAVPMVLARTGQRASALALVQSAAGIGGAVGGFLMGVWGGPKDKVRGILLGDSLNFIALSLCVFLRRVSSTRRRSFCLIGKPVCPLGRPAEQRWCWYFRGARD
jgi:predicted MFS family arabinose efflux permease